MGVLDIYGFEVFKVMTLTFLLLYRDKFSL